MTVTQKALRSFYEHLNNLIHNYKSIHCISSKFADLQYANHASYNTKKIYSFIRYHEQDEQLLFIINFDFVNSYNIELTIPNEVWTRIGLDLSKVYTLEEVFIDRTRKFPLRANENLHLTLPNNQVYVFLIK